MIITCQKCATQYYLEHQTLAPDGRTLKCSQCKSTWFQKYVAEPKIKPSITETQSFDLQQDQIFLPAVVKAPASVWPASCAVILLCLTLGLAIIFLQDNLTQKYTSISHLYDKVGIPSIRGMKIQNVEISHRNSNQIDINGIVKNHSGTYKRVPPMVIFLFDENGSLLKTVFIPAPPKYLTTGDKYAFYKKIQNSFAKTPKIASIALASGTEVMLHSLSQFAIKAPH